MGGPCDPPSLDVGGLKNGNKYFCILVRSDWGAGHLIIIVETEGRAFANKSFPQGQAFDQLFQMPGIFPEEECSRLELTCT